MRNEDFESNDDFELKKSGAEEFTNSIPFDQTPLYINSKSETEKELIKKRLENGK
jgi:hypothetical protein